MTDLDALKKEARNRKTPLERLRELARMDPQLSRAIARGKHTPVQMLEELAGSEDVFTRAAVARNPSTPVFTLEGLAHTADVSVLNGLGRHPNATITVLSLLAQHKQASVKLAVAGNSRCPPHVLHQLALNGPQIQRAVVWNPSTSSQTLRELYDLRDVAIYPSLASHPNTPEDILLDLLRSEDDHIKFALQTRAGDWPPHLIPNLIETDSTEILDALARECDDPDSLEMLADAPNARVRTRVAQNRETPIHVLLKLSKDSEPSVLSALASNPRTPMDVLKQLSQQPVSSIRYQIAVNPKTSRTILTDLTLDPAREVREAASNRVK